MTLLLYIQTGCLPFGGFSHLLATQADYGGMLRDRKVGREPEFCSLRSRNHTDLLSRRYQESKEESGSRKSLT